MATAASVVAQMVLLRHQLGGLDLGRLLDTGVRVGLASAALAGVSYAVWWALDDLLGRGLGGQVVSMTAALAAGGAVYAAAVYAMRVPEARQIMGLLPGRSRSQAPEGE